MGLSLFPRFSEDLPEALLEFTAALTHLEMLPPLPLSWQSVGLKTQYRQSPCDRFEGLRAKRPLRKPSPKLQQQYSMLSPTLNAALTPFLRVVYGHPWSFIMKSSLIFHAGWLNPAIF